VQDEAGLGLPQPVADLVVIGLDLVRFGDPGVVAQAVEELRPVGLGVGRLDVHPLDVDLPPLARLERVYVEAFEALPHAGERSKGPQIA
jgi:hypothetical protein